MQSPSSSSSSQYHPLEKSWLPLHRLISQWSVVPCPDLAVEVTAQLPVPISSFTQKPFSFIDVKLKLKAKATATRHTYTHTHTKKIVRKYWLLLVFKSNIVFHIKKGLKSNLKCRKTKIKGRECEQKVFSVNFDRKVQ